VTINSVPALVGPGGAACTRIGRGSRRFDGERVASFAFARAALDAGVRREETRGCIRCGPLIVRRRNVVEAGRVVFRDVLV
jgi:hypothetical protein